MPSSNLICIAEITGSHGVKGAMKLRVYLENPEDLKTYMPLLKEDGTSFPFKIIQSGPKGILIQSPEAVDRTQADILKGMKLFIPRDRLQSLPEEEYYHTDLVGCEVRDQTGKVRGQVKAVLNYGAGDILEVSLGGIRESLLILFRKEFVLDVHIKEKYIVVDATFLDSEMAQNAASKKPKEEQK